MERDDRISDGMGMGGPANTPQFGEETRNPRTAKDQQTGEQRGRGHQAHAQSETQREVERTRDLMAETAAPVMAEKTQEAIRETADRVSHDPRLKEQLRRTATAAQHDAQRMATEKMGAIGHNAENRLNQGMHQAANRISDVAHRIDSLADERLDGDSRTRVRANQMAHSVADSIENAAGYLRDRDLQGLRSDLERQVREKPVQTLLMAVGIGWLAGKILR